MRRWRRRGIVIALTGFLVWSAALVARCGPPPLGRFDGPAGEAAYRDAYAAGMARLPQPRRASDLVTDFGIVRVYEFGDGRCRTSVPLVLLPGRSSGAPMWGLNLPGLAAERSVLTIDTLGDAGMSVQTRPIASAADQAAWIEQALERRGARRVHLVGHSFGGWLAANYASRYPARVATLSLLEPVLVFQGLRWQFIVATIPASLKFLPSSWRSRMLAYIGGDEAEPDPRDPIARMITAATEHYSVALPTPDRLSDEALGRLRMPVYAALASESVLHDAGAALDHAKARVAGVEGRVWDGATHSLPLEVPEAINREVLNFIGRHDPCYSAAREDPGAR